MGRFVLSDVAFARVADKAKAAGSATHAGEERQRNGLGLDPLVDPAEHGVIRRSLSWLEPEGDYFTLLRGVAILEETRLDTTGSMHKNVEIAMRVLPTTYKLLSTGPNAVLRRYDTQMITSIFGDERDRYILCRSQAEMDDRIAEQMTLMVPEGGGWGNGKEDPQYGLFGGAYLTQNSINDYGLKGYDFTISDEPVPDYIDEDNLIRVFGSKVFEKVAENGHSINRKEIPRTKQVVTDLLKRAHAFFLYVETGHRCFDVWERLFGKERVIKIPDVEYLPHIKATIIGLTEGVLDLQTAEEFLAGIPTVGNHTLGKGMAREIIKSVTHIPIGAQSALPNFGKIPLKGDKFAKKGDIWPMSGDFEHEFSTEDKNMATDKKRKMWL